jgi:hypothetical protein
MPSRLKPEDIRRHGVEELETLRNMVQNWRENYIQEAPAGGGKDYLFLCDDFTWEIEEFVYPYVRRMVVTDHIDQTQAQEILDFCYRQVLELRSHLNIGDESPN